MTIEETIGKRLLERQGSLAVAESCTGGHLANRITNVSGSSHYFERGVVTYSNQSKIDLLGIDPALIKEHGAVSSEIARTMAEGIKRTSGATYGIATTGIAGPTGGMPGKPAGTVFIALATPEKTEVKKFYFPQGRLKFKELATTAALEMLGKELS